MSKETLQHTMRSKVRVFEDGGIRLLRKGQKGLIHAIFSRFGLVLVLLVLLISVGMLWKRLHRDQRPNPVEGPTILQQELTGTEWNTISYTPARRLSVQTLDNGMTAMDFRLAAQPASPAVERSSFSDVSFLGDSLTQGMQIYSSGLPEASFCAYRGANPSVVVNGTTCKRSDGGTEVPMEVLTARQPPVLYILLGTNTLTTVGAADRFLAYYGQMLDVLRQTLGEGCVIYVQSIPPVRPEAAVEKPGLASDIIRSVNEQLALLAADKGCVYLDLWETLADGEGNLKEVLAAPDGVHFSAGNGYGAWVTYLRNHAKYAADNIWTPGSAYAG